jgi:octaheme c-type cytochrome (tetrathionate reductase family)
MPLTDRIRNFRWIWVFGLVGTALLIVVPLLIFIPRSTGAADDPSAHLAERLPHTDHSDLLEGPFENGSQVTQACLECHPQAAEQVMGTTHWTWEDKPVQIGDRPEPVAIGKKNLLNNFCIGIQSNWAGCTSCHAGYGWQDADFDFNAKQNVDCLICHDGSGVYAKTKAGMPKDGVDLLAAAKSVGYPTRDNCGTCHFNGGGGNAVKHGDLDQHLYYPDQELDVHMGGQGFQCTDCHQTRDHQIRGKAISTSFDMSSQVRCTDCHNENPHQEERLNDHVDSVACQTCHIPAYGRGDPTKMEWDWSTAGQDREESDSHEYLKIKGSFVYEENVTPEYYWYNGIKDRYLLGDKIDPSQPTVLNPLAGDIHDPEARIFPFKVHRAKQPYDTVNNILLQPRTAGEGGFWTTFDWQSALELGSQDVGLPFSGKYSFAETWMYWPITHTVAPGEEALQCAFCHSPDSRLDWQALGYPGDPMEWGGR